MPDFDDLQGTRSNVSALMHMARHQLVFSILPDLPTSALIAASTQTNQRVSIFPSRRRPVYETTGSPAGVYALQTKSDAVALMDAHHRKRLTVKPL